LRADAQSPDREQRIGERRGQALPEHEPDRRTAHRDLTPGMLGGAAYTMLAATTSGAYTGGGGLTIAPSLLRACSKNGVSIEAGRIVVTAIGAPSWASSIRRQS
jgi:hypothetical protein